MATDDAQETLTDINPAESALVSKYERRVEFPEELRSRANRWEPMREYVHTNAMLLDEEDAIGTNFIFRNQQVATALLVPEDPAPRIAPQEMMPAPEAQGTPVSYPAELVDYARTNELLIKWLARKGHLQRILEGAAQDAQTVPLAWIKMRVQEDFDRDPVGTARINDQLDTFKRYERLKLDLDEGVIDERSAEFAELQRLNAMIRDALLGDLEARIQEEGEPAEGPDGDVELNEDGNPRLEGVEALLTQVEALTENPEALVSLDMVPEVAHYRGFVWQQVDPEDVRWDWSVRRPEDLLFARWMAHRVWMTPSEIREKWGVSDDFIGRSAAGRAALEREQAQGSSSADEDHEYGDKDDEERHRDAETDDEHVRGESLAVWEYWDRVQSRVYRWVAGTGAFLDDFTPSALPQRFFPFYLVDLNRVTGRFDGISDTDLQQPLQDESNRVRTWQREAQKSNHPRWMVQRGLLSPREKARFEAAIPYSLTETENTEELAKMIFPILQANYDPNLYDRSSTILEMQQMAGIPIAALGAGAASGLATDSAIANQQMGQQVQARRKRILGVLREMFQAMAEISAQILPEENVRSIVGPGAVWPQINRQQMLAGLVIEVDAVLDDVEARAAELKAWLDFAQIIFQLQLPINKIAIAKKILQLMGIRESLAPYLDVNALLMQLNQMGADLGPPAPGATGSAPNPQTDPARQGGQGAAGGAPAGEGLSAPPSPASVPNSPA